VIASADGRSCVRSSELTEQTHDGATTRTATHGGADGRVQHVPGTAIGRYTLGRELGRGGMGSVHEAWDPKLSRTVALKLISSNKRLDGRARAGFVREARALASFSHPHVVPIYDFGSHDDELFIAMQCVEGQSLAAYAREHRDPTALIGLLRQAGEGLAAAHRAGLVHRDFKPANVLVDRSGRAFVCDFGLAALRETSETETSGDSNARTSSASAHEIAGTLAYMPPEQHESPNVDASADQYAFCVSAWEVLTGQRPFRGPDTIALITAKLTGPERSRLLPRRIERVLARGLARNPSARWRDMDALLEALEARPRWTRAAAMAVVLGLGGTGLAAMERAAPCPLGTVEVPARVGPNAPEVERKLRGSLTRYAEADAERVATVCHAWQASHSAAEAARACVEREHEQFEVLVSILASGSEPRISSAVPVARDLAQSLHCSPEAVANRSEAGTIVDLIQQGRTALLADRLDEAESFAMRARRRSERIESSGLAATADMLLLAVADQRGIGPQERADLMWKIAEGAHFATDSEFAVRGQLVTLIWAACQDPQRAEALAERTWGAIDRAGRAPSHLLLWLAGRTRLAVCSGDPVLAATLGETARAIAPHVDDQEARSVALGELSMVYGNLDATKADPVLDEYLAASIAAYGDGSYKTAQAKLLTAEIRSSIGHVPALEMARSALSAIGVDTPPDSPGWADAVQRVARVEFFLGEGDAAVQRLEALLQTAGPSLPPPSLAALQKALVTILSALDRNPERRAELLDAMLPALVGAYGDGSEPVLEARYQRADTLLALGRLEQALAATVQLRADAEQLYGTRPSSARYLALLGRAQVELGQHHAAEETLAEAWARHGQPNPPNRRAVYFALLRARAAASRSTARAERWLATAERYADPGGAQEKTIERVRAQVEASAQRIVQDGSNR